MPKADSTSIDTAQLGLATHVDGPKTSNNRHRSKWRVRFDTGVDMYVPASLFELMVLHLEEADPR